MKANPGGQLAPENIVGRDDLIAQIWEILEGRSIYMNDLRRVGKTMILRKMETSPPPGWLVVKRDLGGCHSAAEFATQAFKDSADVLGKKKRALRRMGELIGAIKGVEIVGVLKLPNGGPAPWKEVLTRTFSDLDEEMAESKCRFVFLWDEVPFLLDNVAKRESAETAMEILDMLRSLSQDYSNVRLLLTGSVGLHHILSTLRKGGYLNSPLNHMERIAPGPLPEADSCNLALALLTGSGASCANHQACAEAIAVSVGHVAFYIHKLISRLPGKKPITPELITETLQREIVHPDNDWDLAHYRTRIPLYYGKDERLVLHILDAVAASAQPLSFDSLRKQVSSQSRYADAERIRRLLKLLLQDHYLDRTAEGSHYFRFELIRRWWKLDRGLP